MQKIIIFCIKGYQKYISPLLPNSCVFYAHGQKSCSQYAIHVVKNHGVIKGTMFTLYRIIRCNPWQKHFTDPL
jgi:putative membrane protein insertion efficiency factor